MSEELLLEEKPAEDKEGWGQERLGSRGALDALRSNDNYWHLEINILAQALFLH